MKKYVLGIDGGSTKSQYGLFDIEGNMINFLQGGCVNHAHFTDKYDGMERELKKCITEITNKADIDINSIEFCFLGISGADSKNDHIEISRKVSCIGIGKFEVCNDAFLGILAGSPKKYGVCSVNGTGTNCAAIDRKRQKLLIGGWPYGGGNYLIHLMLKRVYDHYFRCGKYTIMAEKLFMELGLSCEDEMEEIVYKKVYGRQIDRSRLTSIPFYAVSKNDEVAKEILDIMALDAARSVAGAVNRLDFSQEKEVDVILAGSIYVKGEDPYLINAFKRYTKELLNAEINFILLDVPPVAGAVIQAVEIVTGLCDKVIYTKIIKTLSTLCEDNK
ncbi:MAG TPA: BadF/BadG/BcrA/BcrD ATPase family protein [Clostridiales bacterium]|nr:BadF/BadG/BcrA/BcrD ATPase family protein [Clostridiales bacterium]